MKNITVGGVPEHFNYPWHWGAENNLFSANGLNITWVDVPQGTGAMLKQLHDGVLDVAIVLTEGAVLDRYKGNDTLIIAPFVKTPLLWGIHVSASSLHKSIQIDHSKRYAVSRLGSGSHLMACVHAQTQGIILTEQQMVITHTLDGATQSLIQNQADYFFWEKFTTKPLVDRGIFRLLDVFPSPWPAFVIVIKESALSVLEQYLPVLLHSIRKSCEEIATLPDLIQRLSLQYGLEENDLHQWVKQTKWAEDASFNKKDLMTLVTALQNAGLLTQNIPDGFSCLHTTVIQN